MTMEHRASSHFTWLRGFQIAALLVLGAALASGQSVRWQPDRGPADGMDGRRLLCGGLAGGEGG